MDGNRLLSIVEDITRHVDLPYRSEEDREDFRQWIISIYLHESSRKRIRNLYPFLERVVETKRLDMYRSAEVRRVNRKIDILRVRNTVNPWEEVDERMDLEIMIGKYIPAECKVLPSKMEASILNNGDERELFSTWSFDGRWMHLVDRTIGASSFEMFIDDLKILSGRGCKGHVDIVDPEGKYSRYTMSGRGTVTRSDCDIIQRERVKI